MRLSIAALVLACGTAASEKPKLTVDLPGGKPGIGFDDLGYSPRLHRVLVPAGRSGNLVLVDPSTRAVTAISGFSASKDFDGGHDFGITSADDTGSAIAVADRTTDEVILVDPDKKMLGARAKLAGGPDYVRYVAATKELWVTEPDREQIEVLSLALKQVATIAVKGGPESLVIDNTHGRAYTNLWEGATVAIDIKTRAVAKPVKNGCKGSRGIAVDETTEIVLVGCADGKVTSLRQSLIASLKPVDGMDIIAWSPTKRHLYLAGEGSADTAIVAVSDKGALVLAGKAPGAAGGHCVTTDDAGHAFVCDPRGGRLIAIEDTAK